MVYLPPPLKQGFPVWGGWGAEFQKDYFFRYPDFQLKNVWILYLVRFVTVWCIKVNIGLFSAHLYSFGIEFCYRLTLFHPNILRLLATVWKCPDFVPEMSSILDTGIPTICNSDGGLPLPPFWHLFPPMGPAFGPPISKFFGALHSHFLIFIWYCSQINHI